MPPQWALGHVGSLLVPFHVYVARSSVNSPVEWMKAQVKENSFGWETGGRIHPHDHALAHATSQDTL